MHGETVKHVTFMYHIIRINYSKMIYLLKMEYS